MNSSTEIPDILPVNGHDRFPLLSNMGVINPLQFGRIAATDAYIVTPTFSAPGFMLAVSTYNRTLSLEASYYEPCHKKEEVEAFMDLMERELKSL